MFKKIIFSSLFLIISTHAMDQSTVTVLLEKSWLEIEEVDIPIDDNTTVGNVASHAASKFNEMKILESKGQLTLGLTIIEREGLPVNEIAIHDASKIKAAMDIYGTKIFNLVETGNYHQLHRW